MNRFDQNEIPVAYPPAQQGASYVTAPPPVGYPTRDGTTKLENQTPVQTRSRGDGFWKGW
ncbi:putative cysteine-rich and transmembrane domain-containing protein WIH1/2 [Helianthus debilis subsp. tardiflorus]